MSNGYHTIEVKGNNSQGQEIISETVLFFIYQCLITNFDTGISLNFVSNVNINDCIITTVTDSYSPGSFGIYLNSASENYIALTTINYNFHGIWAQNSDSNVFQLNLISENDYGIVFETNCRSNDVSYNDLDTNYIASFLIDDYYSVANEIHNNQFLGPTPTGGYYVDNTGGNSYWDNYFEEGDPTDVDPIDDFPTDDTPTDDTPTDDTPTDDTPTDDDPIDSDDTENPFDFDSIMQNIPGFTWFGIIVGVLAIGLLTRINKKHVQFYA
ncbi:MAG: right-handed parallel beta-helix repeat-containing protein [Promethearchaeota archaeon]